MQGRLSTPYEGRIQCFPRDTWEDELALAPTIGLNSIEWIYDLFGDGVNPIETDDGINLIKTLAHQHRVKISSVCADWFIDKPLIGVTPAESISAFERLEWLLGRGRLLKISRIVLPFVDNSAINTTTEIAEAKQTISKLLPLLHESAVEVHLETSLNPTTFAEFLDELKDPMVRVNYDIGNSASLGYNPREEFAMYGHRIGSIHIKDRTLYGGTVPLGTGDADFGTVFDELARLRYRGPFILQVARGEPGDEIDYVNKTVDTVVSLFTNHRSDQSGLP